MRRSRCDRADPLEQGCIHQAKQKQPHRRKYVAARRRGVVSADRLYVSDPFDARVIALDPGSMQELDSWRSLPRLSDLALGPDNLLWAVQEAGDEQPARLLALDGVGAIAATVQLPVTMRPVDLAFDPEGRLWVQTAGPTRTSRSTTRRIWRRGSRTQAATRRRHDATNADRSRTSRRMRYSTTTLSSCVCTPQSPPRT